MKQQTGNFRQRHGRNRNDRICHLSAEPDEELLTIRGVDRKRLFSRLIVCDRSLRFRLDCGATVNLLPFSFVRSIDPHLESMRPAASTLRMYDQSILETEGMMSAQVTHPLTKQVSMLEFYVATKHNQPILGLEACLLFDLLAVNEENICVVNPTLPTAGSSLTKECVVNRYPDLFVGYGTLPGEVHLEVDPNVVPVQIPLRRIPVAIKDKVIAELNKLSDNGIIAPVKQTSSWISALMAVADPRGGPRGHGPPQSS